MIYLNHDFYLNFTAGHKAGDYDIIHDLFINEITDLVVFNTAMLVALLNKVGIKASPKDTDQALLEKILKNLPTNKNLVKGLAFLFADTNKLVNEPGISKEKAKKTVSDIAAGLDDMARQLKAKPSLIMSLQKDMLRQIKVKGSAKGDYSRITGEDEEQAAKKAKRRFWLFALAVLAIAAGVIWYRHRRENMPAMPAPEPLPAGNPAPADVTPVATPPASAAPAASPAPAPVADANVATPQVSPAPAASNQPAIVNG